MRGTWPAPRFAQLGAFRVAYRDLGAPDGPPVLFVHGLGSSGLSWSRNVARLGARHRLIVVDLPGCGDSAKPPYRYTLGFFARRPLRLLDHLGVERPVWAGHSMGAHIAMLAALEHPERVRALLLSAPAGFERFTEAHASFLRRTVTPDWVRRQKPRDFKANLEVAFHSVPPEAENLVARRFRMRGPELEGYAHAFSRCVHAMLDAPLWERLPELRPPVLAIYGEDDRLIPNRWLTPHHTTRSVAEAAVARIPRARLVMLPRAGHMVHFERPTRFDEEATRFLDALETPVPVPVPVPMSRPAAGRD